MTPEQLQQFTETIRREIDGANLNPSQADSIRRLIGTASHALSGTSAFTSSDTARLLRTVCCGSWLIAASMRFCKSIPSATSSAIVRCARLLCMRRGSFYLPFRPGASGPASNSLRCGQPDTLHSARSPVTRSGHFHKSPARIVSDNQGLYPPAVLAVEVIHGQRSVALW